ncbi:MAG TPA: hypothetical protein VN843_15975, partial [Anaerolineales bacterium]|nr:hypothetical protein [Anaerolineales bacterium]
MALKHPFTRAALGGGLLLVVFVYTFFNPISHTALGTSKIHRPDFTDFSTLVENGNIDVLSGVYV